MAQIREVMQNRMNLQTPPDRKSIYDDLRNLNAFLDPQYEEAVQTERGKTDTHYKLIQREFELSELKLIIDTVASSKFLSEAKSRELIKKLEQFCSQYQRRELNRQVAVMGRAKSMNNSVLYNVDAINAALDSNMMISFKYFQYNLKLEREYQRKGERYLVSPWALIYDNNEYYLLAYTEGEFRHYRVDKMADVKQEAIEREGLDAYKAFDMADYTKSTFGMYSGEKKKVTMVFQNRMIGTVIDKFGKDVWLSKVDSQHFKIVVPVAVSPQFFAWVFGLGNYVTITDPPEVVDEMKKMLDKVSKRYD